MRQGQRRGHQTGRHGQCISGGGPILQSDAVVRPCESLACKRGDLQSFEQGDVLLDVQKRTVERDDEYAVSGTPVKHQALALEFNVKPWFRHRQRRRREAVGAV